MSENLKRLHDIFLVQAQEDLHSMSTEDKKRFCDEAMTGPKANRGILVTFNLSSAGRRINNRIYTPRGQRAGVSSWVKPYGKPILLHHDRTRDPIGRILSVDYVENDQEAMRFFRSLQDFSKFKSAMESDEPEKIFRALYDNNLLANPAWPGLGHLRAKARINDRDAIEKFLDQRYLTFSAGSHSDRYVCSSCGSDWLTGEMCEHTPGKMSEDGLPTVFITGTFYGDEASIVNEPANTLSTVHSIEFADSVDRDRLDLQSISIDPTTIYSVDSIVTRGEIMSDISDENVNEVVEQQPIASIDSQTLQRMIADSLQELEAGMIAKAIAAFKETLKTEEVEVSDNATVHDPAECESCKTLQRDYAAALQQIEILQQNLENLQNSQTTLDTEDATSQNEVVVSSPVTEIQHVDNPSIAGHGTGTELATAKLGDYERNIVARYQDILNKQGKNAAELFLYRKKAARYVPQNFNPIQYIQESD